MNSAKPNLPKKSRQQKDLKMNEICKILGAICPPGSFRLHAAECGVWQTRRLEVVAGRPTYFFDPSAVEIVRQHIERKRAERMAANGR